MSSFWLYFTLGYKHVLDVNAYDHVLFLIVLTVPYTFNNWKKVLWLVTVFTIGHTLSLMLSVYNVVNINEALVEFLIPITILIAAGFNVFTAGKSKQKAKFGLIFFATLFFGIIHGLGFSNYFKQIVAVEGTKFLPLLEFALGIEAAQVVIVLVVLLLGVIFQSVFRFSRRDWVLVVSAIVIGRVLPMLGL
ncbi:MAG: HupE/UreJ family protein [Bacteroidota bacterium]